MCIIRLRRWLAICAFACEVLRERERDDFKRQKSDASTSSGSVGGRKLKEM